MENSHLLGRRVALNYSANFADTCAISSLSIQIESRSELCKSEPCIYRNKKHYSYNNHIAQTRVKARYSSSENYIIRFGDNSRNFQCYGP